MSALVTESRKPNVLVFCGGLFLLLTILLTLPGPLEGWDAQSCQISTTDFDFVMATGAVDFSARTQGSITYGCDGPGCTGCGDFHDRSCMGLCGVIGLYADAIPFVNSFSQSGDSCSYSHTPVPGIDPSAVSVASICTGAWTNFSCYAPNGPAGDHTETLDIGVAIIAIRAWSDLSGSTRPPTPAFGSAYRHSRSAH